MKLGKGEGVARELMTPESQTAVKFMSMPKHSFLGRKTCLSNLFIVGAS